MEHVEISSFCVIHILTKRTFSVFPLWKLRCFISPNHKSFFRCCKYIISGSRNLIFVSVVGRGLQSRVIDLLYIIGDGAIGSSHFSFSVVYLILPQPLPHHNFLSLRGLRCQCWKKFSSTTKYGWDWKVDMWIYILILKHKERYRMEKSMLTVDFKTLFHAKIRSKFKAISDFKLDH